MDRKQIIELIQQIKAGQISDEAALNKIETFPFEKIEYAMIDHHRAIRLGFPEIIFCHGKTPEQVREIALRIRDKGADILATRAHDGIWDAVRAAIPNAHYNPRAQTIWLNQQKQPTLHGKVLIVTAGTADLPVAEESLECARALHLDVGLLADVGVAGIHRIFSHRDLLETAAVLIVIAGMEGALPSVVAGLVRCPVIAVPTSVGYGTSFGGIAALLAMLNSCVPGIAVMNIDNGLGAAFLAFRILSTRLSMSNEHE